MKKERKNKNNKKNYLDNNKMRLFRMIEKTEDVIIRMSEK